MFLFVKIFKLNLSLIGYLFDYLEQNVIVTVMKVTMAMTTMMLGWKIMINQLVPCRGGTETFAHAAETKP